LLKALYTLLPGATPYQLIWEASSHAGS